MIPFANDTITRLRAVVSYDSGNAAVRTYSESLDIPDVMVQPWSSMEEDATNRDVTYNAYKVFADIGTDVREDDRIVWNGRTFTVEGVPQLWTGPLPHLDFVMRDVNG